MPEAYFISYTSVDKAWAEWVGWVLEEAGSSVVARGARARGSGFAAGACRTSESRLPSGERAEPGSSVTLRWREMDSNCPALHTHRFGPPCRLRDGPVRRDFYGGG